MLCCTVLLRRASVVLHNGYGMVWDIWLLNSTHIIHITPTLSYIHHTAYYHSITYHLSPHPVHRSLLFLLACACCVVHPCPSLPIHNPQSTSPSTSTSSTPSQSPSKAQAQANSSNHLYAINQSTKQGKALQINKSERVSEWRLLLLSSSTHSTLPPLPWNPTYRSLSPWSPVLPPKKTANHPIGGVPGLACDLSILHPPPIHPPNRRTLVQLCSVFLLPRYLFL